MNRSLTVCMLILFLVGASACSQLNPESKRHFEESRPKLRHGIIPADTSEPGAAIQLRPVNLQAVERGRVIYRQNCIECHGADGRGDQGPDLTQTVSEVPHFEFFISFSQYQGTMPGWKNPLTKKEREDLVEYLKTLND